MLGTAVAVVSLAIVLAACSSPDYGSSQSDGGVPGTDVAGQTNSSGQQSDPTSASGGDSVAPSAIVGVWTASDGSGTKVIDQSGQCSGMYWNDGTPLDIGGPMRCTLGSQQAADGSYVLVVQQPPNQASYPVTFHGNSFTLVSGSTSITLTRQ